MVFAGLEKPPKLGSVNTGPEGSPTGIAVNGRPNVRVDIEGQRVYVGDEEFAVTNEARLLFLAALIKKRGNWISFEEMILIFPELTGGNQSRIKSELIKKVPLLKNRIESIRGKGYRLV